LRHSRGCNLRQSEEHHETKDFDLIGLITNSNKNMVEEFVEVEFAQAGFELIGRVRILVSPP
jgi:hypothetical protein